MPFVPISALQEKLNPRSIGHTPPVKFSLRLELKIKFQFLKGA